MIASDALKIQTTITISKKFGDQNVEIEITKGKEDIEVFIRFAGQTEALFTVGEHYLKEFGQLFLTAAIKKAEMETQLGNA